MKKYFLILLILMICTFNIFAQNPSPSGAIFLKNANISYKDNVDDWKPLLKGKLIFINNNQIIKVSDKGSCLLSLKPPLGIDLYLPGPAMYEMKNFIFDNNLTEDEEKNKAFKSIYDYLKGKVNDINKAKDNTNSDKKNDFFTFSADDKDIDAIKIAKDLFHNNKEYNQLILFLNQLENIDKLNNEDKAIAYTLLGESYYKLKLYEKAVENINKFLELFTK